MRTIALIAALSLLATALPASADFGRPGEDTFRCTVTVGGGDLPAGPTVGADSSQAPVPLPPAAVGGCEARGELVETGAVKSIDAAEGCTAYADLNDEPGGEMALKEGQPVKEGTGLWFHCEPGVVNAENAITIDFDAA